MLTIIGRAECPWCERVQTLLRWWGYAFEYQQLSGAELRKLAEKHGFRTVPQVFNAAGRRLGGYDNVRALLEDVSVSN